MIQFARHLPAWALAALPVRMARQCVGELSLPSPFSGSKSNQFQLLVDVSVIYQSDARTGIQRVVRALLLQLLQSPPSGYRVCPIYASRKHGYRYVNSDFFQLSEYTSITGAGPVQVENGDIFLGLDLAAHLLPKHQAQMLRWKRTGVKLHIVVYDLLPLLHAEWFNARNTRNFSRWIRWLAVYADNTICISQTVKVELCTWIGARFGLPPHKFPASTITLGADIDASAPNDGLPFDAEILLAKLKTSTNVLMIGTLEPRKGYDQALLAFEKLWQYSDQAPLLLIVGKPGWKTTELQEKIRSHPENGKKLFWLESVSDEYLNQLYIACSGVLIASRAEGFGLPLVEALLHEKPVLARDISVFRELENKGLTYFSGETPLALASAVTHWLSIDSSPTQRSTAPCFPTWKLSATQLINALNLENKLSVFSAKV